MTPLLDGSAVGLLLTGAALVGVIGAVLLTVFRSARWRDRSSFPLAGFLLLVPLLIVTIEDVALEAQVLIGLAMLLAGVVLPNDATPWLHGLAAVPGAIVIGLTFDDWGRTVLVAAVPIVVGAIASFQEGHDHEPGLATVCAAVATGGAFLTVPDTEHVALLAGAGVSVGILAVLEPRLAMGFATPSLVGGFVWAVTVDGMARSASIVGALGALGLLIIDPALRTVLGTHRGLLTYLPLKSPRSHVVAAGAISTAIALFTSRVAGFGDDLTIAVMLTLVAWAVAGGALAWRARQLA